MNNLLPMINEANLEEGDDRRPPRGPLAIVPTITPYTLSLHAGEITERALIIDTETTGRSLTSEIIEVAVCDISGCILFESLVRPTESVPRAAARIHGLTTDCLINAPTWYEVWRQLEPVVNCRTLIAYNAPFDRRMVELECARYRLPAPEVRWRCAMRFIKEINRWRRAPTLEEACRSYQITPGTHRAASDACATALLLQRVLSSSK